MPPGPAYNWLCVLHSVGDVLYHAAQIRATQVAPRAVTAVKRARQTTTDAAREFEAAELGQQRPQPISLEESAQESLKSSAAPFVIPPGPKVVTSIHFRTEDKPSNVQAVPEPPLPDISALSEVRTAQADAQDLVREASPSAVQVTTPPVEALTAPVQDEVILGTAPSAPASAEGSPADALLSTSLPNPPAAEPSDIDVPPTRALKSSKVPSSRIGRLFHYGGLAASLGYGAASEALRRTAGGSSDADGSLLMTEANVARLVDKLVRMRGAALKLGQFLSIQDTQMVPPQVEEIFRRVQDSAHYMPDWQTEQVLRSLLASYPGCFSSFTRTPFAAASIGQVHAAVLAADASPTGKEERVAVKVQFPNVRESLGTDLGYVRALLTVGRVLPKGMFLERTVEVMKQELADECDYVREATFINRFREHVKDDTRFRIPWVWEGSSKDVLVMEHIDGVSVGAVMSSLSQADRDEIGTRIIELCLKELFVFRAMQTDPNWSNFLWDARTRRIGLVDFGAARAYSKEFIDKWLRLLQAAISDDEAACVAVSRELGYLTGEEDAIMTAAHVRSMRLLGTPFRAASAQPVGFGPGTEWAAAAAEIRALVPVMLQRRLTPPPRETYSLNRKLSGAFLLAARLGARVECRRVWEGVVGGYQFGPEAGAAR